MGESLLLITLFTVVILAIRRGKPVILDNPVIIERPGHYHITLAPQLNQAQTFVEAIARQWGISARQAVDLPAQYYEVRDPRVSSRDTDFYLLAVALRGGMLYLQAINPLPLVCDADSHFKTVHDFSEKVLVLHPLPPLAGGYDESLLNGAVEAAASQLNIIVKILQAVT
ncbi:MAG: hypothetical protein COZ20_03740 [Gallionellales bacterium CG_4_10_14_3_um_filter_54_96]|nr:hypothetical protein [Gallionella sp.]OIO83110.1 MAG: hypothetical protein AUJ88_00170 [Gallionellaceae bacterium CG1_02_56_997]PIV14804.1 MAG: hypothetical protein COS43_05640 [Gallionellales bacterium CG03_land_8_20_14_0_80_55_15]PIX05509.1 MAG: hypothetical protein COZ77_00795 [Gallionellales bacterium CG_4_8_14_3_um_filter_54_18]PIY05204.1 MAG: hypothetical protein COZ20_03740 [Gallionellales bacterium CG_4_10_14_3_um_filter_54_96]PJC05451.1 MAG: hypothetical protein CO070_02540 [Gallio